MALEGSAPGTRRRRGLDIGGPSGPGGIEARGRGAGRGGDPASVADAVARRRGRRGESRRVDSSAAFGLLRVQPSGYSSVRDRLSPTHKLLASKRSQKKSDQTAWQNRFTALRYRDVGTPLRYVRVASSHCPRERFQQPPSQAQKTTPGPQVTKLPPRHRRDAAP